MKRFFALTAILALGLGACKPVADTGPIKIGMIDAITGDIASIGADLLHAAEMKVKEVNATGGIDGREVVLIPEDGRCSGTEAASAAQKLINVDKVVAIVGGLCSGETLAAAPIAEAAKIVLLSPTSSSPDVTTAGEFIFRNYPSDDLKGKAFANFFTGHDITKVAIISENTDFCQGIVKSIEKYLPQGVEIVFDQYVDPGTKDYRSVMTRMKDVDFDVFIVNSQSDPTGAAMLTQLRELGFKQVAIGTDTSDSETMNELAAGALDNFFVISVPIMGDTSSFAQKFLKEYGQPQFAMVYAAHAYDAMTVILNTIDAVGTDGVAMRDHLNTMGKVQGVSGTFEFDENGDAQGYKFALKEFKDGAIREVEPLELD